MAIAEAIGYGYDIYGMVMVIAMVMAIAVATGLL